MPRRRRPPRPGALTELPPLKILSQIVLLQVVFYASGIALILFTALVAGTGFSFDLVFGWKSLRGDTTKGWMLGLVWMLNSFLGVIALLLIISRSKLIPDFALTLHFIHLLLTTAYSRSIPRNWLWWALQLCSAAFMTGLGVWSCRWRELRPINFGSSSAPATQAQHGTSAAGATNNGAGGGAIEGGDEEQGLGRGSRRGRGRDGAGEYEMVGMKGESSST